MFETSELRALQAVQARADGALRAIVFVMLTNHDCRQAQSERDWDRLRAAYGALEIANVAVREYCLYPMPGEVQ